MRLLTEIRNLIGNYHLKSGVYHYYRNEYKQAVDFLRKAMRDEEELAASDLKKARHYLTLSLMDSARRMEERGELEAAVEELQRAIEVSEQFPDLHFRLGGLLEQLDRGAEALDAYRAAVKHNPRYLDAHVALGFLLLDRGDVKQAGKVFGKAYEVRLDQVREPYGQARDRLLAGDLEGALGGFHLAFRASPRLSDEYVGKALLRLRDEDWDGAIEELDRALTLNPKYPDLHNYRGVALSELGRTAEAAEAFRRSRDLSPDFIVPRLNLAFTHLRAGEYGAAEAELRAVLEREPTESAALAMMVDLEKKGRPEKRRPATRGSAR